MKCEKCFIYTIVKLFLFFKNEKLTIDKHKQKFYNSEYKNK